MEVQRQTSGHFVAPSQDLCVPHVQTQATIQQQQTAVQPTLQSQQLSTGLSGSLMSARARQDAAQNVIELTDNTPDIPSHTDTHSK